MTSTTAEQLDQFRRLIRTIDPAALTEDDRRALIDLIGRLMKLHGR